MKEEIISNKIQKGSRTYFFDVKQTRKGDYCLKISEKKKTEDGLDSHQLMVFDQDLDDFVEAFEKTINEMRPLLADRPRRNTYARQERGEGFRSWTAEEDERLRKLTELGKSEEEIAETLDRRIGAVLARSRKLGLTNNEE